MDKMKKTILVAQVIGMAIDGGVESCIMNYYENIDREKVQFHFLVESTSKIINKEKIESMGGKVIIIPHYSHILRYIFYLKRIFIENNYDIVHSNMNALSIFPLFAAKRAKIGIRIAHSHSTSSKKERKKNLIKNILRKFSKLYATNFFACSKEAGIWLFGQKTFDNGKISIVNNAINLSRFVFDDDKRKTIRRKYEIDGRFVIGNVGRFVHQKNQKFLINIFAELLHDIPNAELLIVGDGPLRKSLVKHTLELGISNRVLFVGNKERVDYYYCAMDYFVFPSLYEGFGMCFVEAQVSGLLCLGSDMIPADAIITNNVKLLSLEKSIDVWERQILLDIKNKGNNNRWYHIFEKTKYNIDLEANKLVILYEEIMKGSIKR